MNKGEIVWQVAHGETPDNIRNHPALKGITIPRTGRPGRIGMLVTKTLVIAGEPGFFTTPNGQRGAMLRAYDKATGTEVGAVYMPAPQTGSPMTYMLGGKQYVVVAISGGELQRGAGRVPVAEREVMVVSAASGGGPAEAGAHHRFVVRRGRLQPAHTIGGRMKRIAAVGIVVLSGLVLSAADRPPVMGRNAGVSAGHPLTTAAAFEVLVKGGNAFDAGVAALLVGGVVEQDLYSLGGEALVLVYPQSERKVTSIVGQGWAPTGATIDYYTQRGKTLDGAGLDPAVVPGRSTRRSPSSNAGARCRSSRSPSGPSSTRARASRCARAPRRRSKATSSSSRRGRRTSATGSGPTGRCTPRAPRSSCPRSPPRSRRWSRRSAARSGAAAPPALPPPAIASTRVTSRLKWWRF